MKTHLNGLSVTESHNHRRIIYWSFCRLAGVKRTKNFSSIRENKTNVYTSRLFIRRLWTILHRNSGNENVHIWDYFTWKNFLKRCHGHSKHTRECIWNGFIIYNNSYRHLQTFFNLTFDRKRYKTWIGKKYQKTWQCLCNDT